MSAAGQIKDMVEAAVAVITGRYDERLDALEERVAKLEAAARTAPARAAVAKKAVPSVKARAGAAEVKGEATGP